MYRSCWSAPYFQIVSFMSQRRTVLIIVGFVAFLVVVLAWNSLTYTVGPGERAVVFRKFQGGLDVDQVYGQGFHVKWPWDQAYVYNVKLKENKSTMEVLSKNGLTITIQLSYRYRPIKNQIGYLHNNVGENYHEAVVVPEIRSATREVIGKYLPEDLYSVKRELIQNEIYERSNTDIENRFIDLDVILIREVGLPPKLRAAIERKLEQEQKSLEYKFKIEQATKEAERRRIEAKGKAQANRLLSKSLTDKILRDKGIEATLKLAQSENSKVVVVGSGKNGLPLILGKQ